MRTTLTLDDDVAAAIEQLRRARDASLKDIVNDALRKGLGDLNAHPKQREPSQTQVVDLGRMRLPSIDNIRSVRAVRRVIRRSRRRGCRFQRDRPAVVERGAVLAAAGNQRRRPREPYAARRRNR